MPLREIKLHNASFVFGDAICECEQARFLARIRKMFVERFSGCVLEQATCREQYSGISTFHVLCSWYWSTFLFWFPFSSKAILATVMGTTPGKFHPDWQYPIIARGNSIQAGYRPDLALWEARQAQTRGSTSRIWPYPFLAFLRMAPSKRNAHFQLASK